MLQAEDPEGNRLEKVKLLEHIALYLHVLTVHPTDEVGHEK